MAKPLGSKIRVVKVEGGYQSNVFGVRWDDNLKRRELSADFVDECNKLFQGDEQGRFASDIVWGPDGVTVVMHVSVLQMLIKVSAWLVMWGGEGYHNDARPVVSTDTEAKSMLVQMVRQVRPLL